MGRVVFVASVRSDEGAIVGLDVSIVHLHDDDLVLYSHHGDGTAQDLPDHHAGQGNDPDGGHGGEGGIDGCDDTLPEKRFQGLQATATQCNCEKIRFLIFLQARER